MASRFSIKEWKVLARAYVLLVKYQLLLPFHSPQMVRESILEESETKAGSNNLNLSKKKLLELFRVAWRCQLIKPKCLATSLAQQAFLSEFSSRDELRIGIKKEGDRLLAHAWCEEKMVKNPDFKPLDLLEP